MSDILTDRMSDADDAPWLEGDTNRILKGAPNHLTILVIAGLDPSGGAGLLADTRVILEHGFHVAGVVTALTEQDSTMCSWMHPVDPTIISNQLARLIDDFEIRGVKVGMLGNTEIARAVATALGRLRDQHVPIVFDPVLRATRGVPLLEGSPQVAFAPILPLCTMVTPNLDELAWLTGSQIDDLHGMIEAGRSLQARGPKSVLCKGGHLPGDPVDVLVDDDGIVQLPAKRIEGPTPHGTGCALSSELICHLALGTPLREATQKSCARIRERIAECRTIGRGRPFLG